MKGISDVPGPPLPGTIQGLLMFRDPYRILALMAARYGDRVRIAFGGRRGVLFSNPEDVREVFLYDPEILRAGAAYLPLTSRTIGQFILTLDGNDYARTRKAVIPAFGTEAMADYLNPIRRVVQSQVDRVRAGVTFDLARWLDEIAYQIAVALMMPSCRGDEASVRGMPESLHAPHRTLGLLVDLIGMSLGLWRYNERRFRMLPQFCRIRAASSGSVDSEPGILSARVRASNRHARAPLDGESIENQLVGIFWSVVNTIAGALQLAFVHLLANPEITQRLCERLGDSAVSSGGGDTLDAFCLEALRITPPVPLLLRILARDAQVAGISMPAGSLVGVSIYGAHHREQVYSDHDRFRLDRFLDRDFSPYEYMPFGSRKRGCLATVFAPVVLRTALGETLASGRLEPAGPSSPRHSLVNLVVRHRDPILVRLKKLTQQG